MELYGLRERPAIVPELIDLGGMAPDARRANPAEPRDFTLLFVGRFYLRKRVNVLLQAAAMLRDSHARPRYAHCGQRPLRRRMARAMRASCAWRARLPGWATSLARNWRGNTIAPTVFCLPSVQEGFGIVLLEAMAAGKPIVAARAAAVPEVAPHAVLVEPDSAEALAAGIERVRGAAPRASRMGGAVRRAKGGAPLRGADLPSGA